MSQTRTAASSVSVDRRDGVRLRTVFQAARLLSDDHREHLCLLRNVSSGGMMLEAFSPIAIATRVRIEPKTLDPIDGTVKWSTDHRLGVAFDAPVDLEQYLSSRRTMLPHQQLRGPRISIDMQCRLRIGVMWHLVSLLDLSQGGAKVITDLPVAVGDAVELDLEGFAPIKAHICWIRGTRVGMTFVQPVQLAAIGQWVAGLSG